MPLKLHTGKLPFVHDDRDLALRAAGLDLGAVSVPEGDFGNYPMLFGKTEPDDSMFWDFTFPLGMYGNDRAGDCVPAWFAHAETLDSIEGDRDAIHFSDDCVLTDYSTVTGYVRGEPATDRGTEMRAYLRYHRRKGILDSSGRRRHIGLFAGFAPRDLDELAATVVALGKASIGWDVRTSAMEQFNAREPFDVVKGAPDDGGHCTGIVGRYKGMWVVETWGTLALMTDAYFLACNDEAWGYYSTQMLNGGRTISGLDREKALAVVEGLS